MDLNAVIKRVDNAYALLGDVTAKGEELDRLAMARQELRTVFAELRQAQAEPKEREGGLDG